MRQAIRSALRLLSRRDRRLLGLATVIQAATSILDLVGVLLIGLVGALAVTTVQSQPPPAAVSQLVDWLGLDNLSDQSLVALLAGVAAVVLLAKSILNTYLTRRTLAFLANRQALVSARLSRELLSRPLEFIRKRTSQETAYALIGGANAATVQLLGQFVIAVSELALLIILAIALLALSPVIAVGAIAFFAAIAYALQRTMGGWASRVGSELARADIASFSAVQEALGLYREISVSHRRTLYVDRIQELRWQAARVAADAQFMGMLPKYMFESALVLGGFVLAVVLFTTQDSVAAIGTLALFLAAATRIMPSLLRLQAAGLGMRTAAGTAAPTLQLSEELDHPQDDSSDSGIAFEIRRRISEGHPGFTPSVEVEDVTYVYPGTSRPALSGVTLRIEPGASVALVGRSGAGKSTLADVILGALSPTSGSVRVSSESPPVGVERWPGATAYVPQTVFIADGSIRANVAIGLPDEAIDDALVWDALRSAHLADYVEGQRDGLSTRVGEGGLRLSGGQRQRLAIARALYTRPLLVVFDEATSALDAETDLAVSTALHQMDHHVTRIIIAHRLSTVRDVDLVVYLDDGRIAATGTFDEVTALVPAFGRQAKLSGL